MRRRQSAPAGDGPLDELLSLTVWCERRGLTGHLDGEAWNDGTITAWSDARTAWAAENGWPGGLDEENRQQWEVLRELPAAPFHPEWI